MHNLDLILTLTGGLAGALVFGFITQKLGLSPIVGYLLAGVAVGPYTPGFVADGHLAEQLAEVGVILLMFGVGLQFHLHELLAVKKVAIPGALAQIAGATLLGFVVGELFGWSIPAGILFGLAISVASTVVLLRVLSDHSDIQTPAGHLAVGWLVVEDILTVLVLVLLPSLLGPGEVSAGGILWGIAVALVKLGVMGVIVLLAGDKAIPWILNRVADTKSRELFTLTVLVIALGIAVLSAKVFGVSMALGAFLAGMVVGRSEFSLRAASEALPMRDAFAVLFFVSVGILLDPRAMIHSWGLMTATLAIILIGKPLVAIGIVLWLGLSTRVAVSVGVALAQIGEFSFILATAGRTYGVLDERATNALISASIVSITLNPLLYRFRYTFAGWLDRLIGSRAEAVGLTSEEHGEVSDLPERYRVVVIGYGPVGQTLCRMLKDNRIQPVVIELNLDTIRRIQSECGPAVYGDATLRDTLEAAGVHKSIGLIYSSAEMPGIQESIRLARELSPSIRIFARTRFVREDGELYDAGANLVFSAEAEVALSMTESLLRQLGATEEQLDRERARIQGELAAKRSNTADRDLIPSQSGR